MARLGAESERYLRLVVAGLPLWIRSEVRDELRTHLDAAIAQRVVAGVNAAIAEAEVLAAFGPVDTVRRDLLRVHRRRARDPYRVLDVLLSLFAHLGFADCRFNRDYALGRYDAIITRGERTLRHGARFQVHHRLGLAYNAIGDHERALQHLHAEVEWNRRHPLPRWRGGGMVLATAYSNLAGVLETLGRAEEADAAVRAGLAVDERHALLNLQRAKQLAARGEESEALRHLERAAGDRRLRPRSVPMLFFTQDASFDALRHDPRFGRVLLQATA